MIPKKIIKNAKHVRRIVRLLGYAILISDIPLDPFVYAMQFQAFFFLISLALRVYGRPEDLSVEIDPSSTEDMSTETNYDESYTSELEFSTSDVTSTRTSISASSTTYSSTDTIIASTLTLSPYLPPTPSPSILACTDATSRLTIDLAKCISPLNAPSFPSAPEANKVADTSVRCICTSSWNPIADEMKFALQQSCTPPNGLTKVDLQTVANSCTTAPFDSSSVIKSLSLKVILASGEVYQPFSKISAAHTIHLPLHLPLIFMSCIFAIVAF